MIRVVSAYKIANSVGAEWFPMVGKGPRYFDAGAAEEEARRLEKESCAPPNYLTAYPCFLLEVRSERGETIHFDLGSPVIAVEDQRANT